MAKSASKKKSASPDNTIVNQLAELLLLGLLKSTIYESLCSLHHSLIF